jgi:hypothetical protein
MAYIIDVQMFNRRSELSQEARELLDRPEAGDVDDPEAMRLSGLAEEVARGAERARRRPAVHACERQDKVPYLSWEAHRRNLECSAQEVEDMINVSAVEDAVQGLSLHALLAWFIRLFSWSSACISIHK